MTIILKPERPILMVDDEPIALRGYEFVLKSEGYSNIVICEDSRDALRLIEENDFTVVVLDLLMPYISGEELMAHICKKNPQTPVIIITGLGEGEDLDVGIRKQAFEVIKKPVEESILLNSVKRAIEYHNTK